MYFESIKPVSQECTIEKWRAHSKNMRKLLDGKESESRDLRNESRKLRYDINHTKSWEKYMNNVKLSNRIYEIEELITYAKSILPEIATEKKKLEEEKFLTETLLQQCDTWIAVCMDSLSCLDKKLESELTRNDGGILETKKEIQLLEDAKINLKSECLSAWEMSNRLESIETKTALNLEFKGEVLAIEERCMAIDKMDTGVSYKVDATEGPKKTLTIEEWSEAVHGLVNKGKEEIKESRKLREQMLASRGVILNNYAIQFDRTDYELRKRIYEINREKNESQFQLMKVDEMMSVTKAECTRLEQFLTQVKYDLKCAETKCSDRFFRPSVDATSDPPFFGLNHEVDSLNNSLDALESHLDILRAFYNSLEADGYKQTVESDSKNKSLQTQVQALDIRIAGRYDPKKIYAYNPDILLSKMVTQLPPPFTLYSDKY